MELQQLFQEITVVSFNLLAVLLQIEDSATLWFNFIDVEVVNTCDFVWVFCSFHILTLLLLAGARLFFAGADFILDAEVEVATVFLPELFEVFTFGFLDGVGELVDFDLRFAESIDIFLFESELGESELTCCVFTSTIDNL